jgi:hypothetical protein
LCKGLKYKFEKKNENLFDQVIEIIRHFFNNTKKLSSIPLGQGVPGETHSTTFTAVTYFNTTMWGSVVADEVPRLPRPESAVT